MDTNITKLNDEEMQELRIRDLAEVRAMIAESDVAGLARMLKVCSGARGTAQAMKFVKGDGAGESRREKHHDEHN